MQLGIVVDDAESRSDGISKGTMMALFISTNTGTRIK